MKVIIFGNGLIGSQAAASLKAAGHDVAALGREAGIDTTTGKGVTEAVAGADVVVDLTNSPSWADDDVLDFFRESTTHLLAAEQAAGVGHHVILSIVGADRLLDAGYMRAKVAQETLVQAGAVPYSIVRSTQFFEFVAGIADTGTVGNTVHATPAHLQPIASQDVASHLAEIITGPPINGTVEIAGPEPLWASTSWCVGCSLRPGTSGLSSPILKHATSARSSTTPPSPPRPAPTRGSRPLLSLLSTSGCASTPEPGAGGCPQLGGHDGPLASAPAGCQSWTTLPSGSRKLANLPLG